MSYDPFHSLPLDKQAHFFTGAAIVGAFWPIHWALSIFLCVLLATLKEFWWDRTHNGEVSWLDFTATILGGAVAGIWQLAVLLGSRVYPA
jgi:hypothetical protein